MKTFRKIFQHVTNSFTVHPVTQLTTFVVLTGTYIVIASFFVVKTNVESIMAGWGETVKINIYLKDSISEAEKEDISKKLKQLKSFEEPQFISKKQAAMDFISSMKNYAPDLLSDSEYGNPLPASFEMFMKSSVLSGDSLNILEKSAQKIQKWFGVEEVTYGQGWVENYSQFVSGIKKSTWAFLVLLLMGSSLIVSNAIRSSVIQRLDEIEVLELVGATRLMIRTPFIMEGVIIGFISSCLAILGTYLLYYWQRTIFIKELGFLAVGTHMHFLSTIQAMSVVFLGVCMGALGSYICVSKINTGWAAAQRTNGKSWL